MPGDSSGAPVRRTDESVSSHGSGLLLRLDGGLEGESMVLRGELIGGDGVTRQHRITWTPLDDGSVRQHWEASPDGEAWTTVFDGLYRKKTGD